MESASVLQLLPQCCSCVASVAKLLPQWCMTFDQLVDLMPVIAQYNIAVNFMVSVVPIIVIALRQQTLGPTVKD